MRPHRRIGHHRPAVRCPIDRRRATTSRRHHLASRVAIPGIGRAGRAAPWMPRWRCRIRSSCRGVSNVWAGGVGRSEDTSMDSSRRTARRRRGLLAVAGAVMISVTAATGSPFAGAAPHAASGGGGYSAPATGELCGNLLLRRERFVPLGAPTDAAPDPRATVYSGINNATRARRRLLRRRCNARRQGVLSSRRPPRRGRRPARPLPVRRRPWGTDHARVLAQRPHRGGRPVHRRRRSPRCARAGCRPARSTASVAPR